MMLFAVIGALVMGLLCLVLALLILTILMNIVCGFLGALRIYRIAGKRPEWRRVLRMAVRHWHGSRFNGDVGTYLLMGDKRVSLDIRDPIYPERIPA